jgi:ABC-2 type transport system ATP-binding protein
MSASPLLQLRHVGRVLAGRPVVTDVSLDLERGSVLGLLGVNGAGKSTTLRMIAGVLAPSSGQVLIAGEDLREHARLAQRQLGYLPEQVPLYSELRVVEYLTFCARLHGLRGAAVVHAVARVIERCVLGDVRRRLLGNLSKGFQQRVGIAQAIVHEPALVVLDEPASGLDPVQAANIRNLVRELGREHAVILSTHLLPDVQACCDRVAILHQGRLRRDEPIQALHEGGALVNGGDAGCRKVENNRLCTRCTSRGRSLARATRRWCSNGTIGQGDRRQRLGSERIARRRHQPRTDLSAHSQR